METVIVKTKFHKLIDKDVQSHISKAYEESLDKDNLINHDIVKSQFFKWLSK
jgi:hypothetical protein